MLKIIVNKFLLTVLLIGLITIKSFSQEKQIWKNDVALAVDKAIEENKKMLFFFTGSDWCGWCKRLQAEVFKTKDFENWADNLVLVELDFPRRSPQDEKIKIQNYQLKSMFKVRGYPSVYFVVPEKTTEGKINLSNLGKMGYVKGGPKKWILEANRIVN